MKIESLLNYFPDNANVIFTNNAEEANTKLLYRLTVACESMAGNFIKIQSQINRITASNEKLELSNEYYKKRNKEQNLIIKSLKKNTHDTSI